MTFLIVIFLVIFVLAPLANAAARRLNPPSVPGIQPGDVARLRDELDQLSAQVSRLEEEQGFMLHLLSAGQKADDVLRLGRAEVEKERSEAADPLPPRTKSKGQSDPATPDGGM